mmetsp:Transcript_30055/g.92958  ORF Transcript_30055/g.92958 Transcript_30055/m.92958 type:complete len:260 (+) Transcript_30055:5073-5852(+)
MLQLEFWHLNFTDFTLSYGICCQSNRNGFSVVYTMCPSFCIQINRHYDWGLRAVKSVLVVAGHLKRAEPGFPEEQLLMRALRDFNVPKIVQQDEVIFFGKSYTQCVSAMSNIGLLNDLFPGVDPPRMVDASLAQCTLKAIEDFDLWPDERFTLKVAQLDELVAIRHCVFVMGSAGAGKSTIWKTLVQARGHREPQQKIRVAYLNPKVLPTEDLYGHIVLQSREWKDGLLSSIMRDLGQITDDYPKWCVRSDLFACTPGA